MKLSCLILTYNEEINISRCLSALSWCDDIVVLDSDSTDDTLKIARDHGARILNRPFDNFANQRNFGLEHGEFENEWVLHLDADEEVTPHLRQTLEAMEPEDGIDAYYIPSKTMLMGQWLKHAGMYPTYQARLGHRDRLRFIQVGHGQREDLPPSAMGQIEVPYLHFSFSHGMRRWLEKHVRYAEDEARLIMDIRKNALLEKSATAAKSSDPALARRRAKVRAAGLPLTLRPIARFFYIYLIKQGFRDGHAGFIYAFMLAVYEGMTAIIAKGIANEGA
ncbi:glycosyltransferase family 2 protein [Erythrobacter sp. MTPC3]|uniref:glycosyltransferase family 2 protein n=1 Tax=Erythrobacter sp. MTPC3 TaxID=3056564 RepID=UPI0036F2513D